MKRNFIVVFIALHNIYLLNHFQIHGSSVTLADGKFKTCAFDALGRDELCVDQKGDKVEKIFDLIGRLVQRNYYQNMGQGSALLESTDSFTYDAASRPLTATKGRYNNTVSFTYDSIGRKKTESLAGSAVGSPASFTTSYNYDLDNRLINVTYPSGNILHKTYTNRNQLNSLIFNAGTIATMTYDNGGREATRIFGNGLVSTNSYNLDNTLSSKNVATKADLSYTYGYDINPVTNILSHSFFSSWVNIRNQYRNSDERLQLDNKF